MSTAKSLSDDQIATIHSWAEGGDQLSDIQKRLGEELDVKVTYLETRFLLEDLKIEIKVEAKPEPEEEEAPEGEAGAAEEGAGEEAADLPPEAPVGDANVSVTVDTVVRPDALVSGRADFGGGKTAAWWLDQMGRLGFDTDDPEFRPSEAQAMAFQTELQKAIQQSGL
ncbi:MAG: hypothetical protein P1U87_20185 [Verrucomicrobiales bacterium]|nr:hypothetical protein [Verrucomicrobiales bacterium]